MLSIAHVQFKPDEVNWQNDVLKREGTDLWSRKRLSHRSERGPALGPKDAERLSRGKGGICIHPIGVWA